ncbi:RsmB/NOP family class I SAM-dependent RNA methyltransferase [Taklimakanibacter lacteus]|uniref:RsmB/NOP family class I SAM-dependent RNA methyltransferase n=1 Tax=Taklimakanibacter lacteus TaxID=2268456 RepID=UPI000E6688B2
MGLSEAAKPDGKAGLAARRAALAILAAVTGEARHFDDALMRDCTAELAPRDRAFVTALVQTSLRRKGECDAVIAQFLAKKLPRKSGGAPLILLMGAAQLLYLEAPPHAVIDTAVTLARDDRDARHFSGLINAVLRKVAAARPPGKPHLNVPQFLWRRWTQNYGRRIAHEIAAAHAEPPPLDLTVKADPEKWAEALDGTLLPTGSLRLRNRQSAIESLAGFAEGAWWVQDAAAALPARLLGDVAGKSVLDLCAAPGGKTAQLAAAGAKVMAVDQSAPRMERVRQNLDRLRLAAELHVGDALDVSGRLFDAVLIDAPCSATGTIRRHPDLPHIKSEGQIAELVTLQERLLDHAATLLRPGGSLVYCTCSLEPEEGEGQVGRFLERHSDFERQPVTAGDVAGEAQFITADGDLRTLPSMNIGADQGLDGFYAARLTRRFPPK